VGVLGFPTTTLIVRTGRPDRNRVSVRLAVETSMRHDVFSTTTRFALTQPAALLGRQGRRICTQHRLPEPCGRPRTRSQGASAGATDVDGFRRLPGTWLKTPIRDFRPTLQATRAVGPVRDSRPSTLAQALAFAGGLLAAALPASYANTAHTTTRAHRAV